MGPGRVCASFAVFKMSWRSDRSRLTVEAPGRVVCREPFGRVRVDKFLPFRWRDVDLVDRVLRVEDSKTEEGILGLHRADIDRPTRVAHVRRRFTGGLEKPGTKTGGERVVPLTQRALAALDMLPPRIGTPILFPAPRGGYLDLEKWRWRSWTPALRAAGVPHRRVNDLRHTFATWAITDGVPTLTLGQVMGTSTVQLEDTYVRWLRSTADSVRAALDAYDSREALSR